MWHAWLPQSLHSWGRRSKAASPSAPSTFEPSPKGAVELRPESPGGTAPSARASSPAEEPEPRPGQSRESGVQGSPRQGPRRSFLSQRVRPWRERSQPTLRGSAPPGDVAADALAGTGDSGSEEGLCAAEMSPAAEPVRVPGDSRSPPPATEDAGEKLFPSETSSGQPPSTGPSPMGAPRLHPELPTALSASLSGRRSVKADGSPSSHATPPDGPNCLPLAGNAPLPAASPAAMRLPVEESGATSASKSSGSCRRHGRPVSRPRTSVRIRPLPADGAADRPHAWSETKCTHAFPPAQLTLPRPPPAWEEEEKAEQLCPLRQASHLTFHVYADMDAYALDRSLPVELSWQERIREAFLSLLPLAHTYGVDRVLRDEDLCRIVFKYFEMQEMFALLDEDSPSHARKPSFFGGLRRSLSHRHRRCSPLSGKAESVASCAETHSSSLFPTRKRKEAGPLGAAAARTAALSAAESPDAGRRPRQAGRKGDSESPNRGTETGAAGPRSEEAGGSAARADDGSASEGGTKKQLLRSRWRAERKRRGEKQAERGQERGDGDYRMARAARLSSEGISEVREAYLLDSRASDSPCCGMHWSPKGGPRVGSPLLEPGSPQEAYRCWRSTGGSGSSHLSGRTGGDSSLTWDQDERIHERRLEAELRKGVAAIFAGNAMGSTLDATPWVLAVDDSPSVRIWNRKYRHSTLLSFRIEGVVDTPLVAVLSVLNEMDMFRDWVPSFSFPVRLGLKDAIRVAQFGRVDQLDIFKIAFPWPVNDRQVETQNGHSQRFQIQFSGCVYCLPFGQEAFKTEKK
ncbi:conserved hypothetical protein [Neospora caninum Liverpool]|uniref:START domain-containing protein n=1 Tax=Neospora caninum (strain Liverpool) TaxID=572307 RepID=F0VH32_NEOCL|nr:conserved hypothetical protein [Neospora caninum Liverpool]CBZ53026.1 conserved hypothetical protein [Neospora caninum Liverpool]|eukprot:XP_003883058.1 conserved hypothetical protein [Neospora caninum Liverpool]